MSDSRTIVADLRPKNSGCADSSQTNVEPRFTDNYLPFLLAQASAMVCEGFSEPLRRAAVSNVAWRILASLRDEGEITVGELSEVVLTIQPRVTQAITELESKGLVTRRRDAEDKRRTLVRITDRGDARVRAMLDTAKECERNTTTNLNAGELDQLKSLLRKLLR